MKFFEIYVKLHRNMGKFQRNMGKISKKFWRTEKFPKFSVNLIYILKKCKCEENLGAI